STGLSVDHPAAGEQQRSLRLGQEGCGPLYGLGITCQAPIHSPVRLRCGNVCGDGLVIQQIAWDVQKDWSTLPRQRSSDGVLQHFWYALGLSHLQSHSRHRLEHAVQVKRLAAITVDIIPRHVASDDDDWRSSLIGQRDTCQEVDRPWP